MGLKIFNLTPSFNKYWIQKYYQNGHGFNEVYSRDNLSKK